MPVITIHYHERATMPDRLEQCAKKLDITVEQLVRRFITEGMKAHEANATTSLGESLEDFLVKNDILKDK